MTGADPGLSIATAVALSGLDHRTLWLAYVSIGGDHSPEQVRAFLAGDLALPAHDTRVLTHVVNEHFRQQGFSNPIKDG